MMITYPAVFRQVEDNRWHCDFPDLVGCYGDGETIDEAIDDAIESEREWIMLRLDNEEDLPKVTDANDIDIKEGELVRNIGAIIKLMPGWEE